jgi:pyruvate dehydrogenase E2 component (dihydrolipoamide acetyltransferase)
MTEVIMPKMGDGMEEGTLLEWLKKEGEKVKSGDVIGTIQTDKATLELEATGSGTLHGLLIGPGVTVPVGKPIAAILKEGETLPDGWGSGAAASTNGTSAPAAAVEPAPVGVSTQVSAPAPAPVSSGRVSASPLAKKIAAEMGIDLATVAGSGPGGRIVEKDVREAARSKPVAAPVVQVPATPADRQVALTRLKQITAKRTLESKQQVPHFYATVEVDVAKILGLRSQFEAEESGKVSINDFVVKACAKALIDMPEVNATFNGTSILQFGTVSIGIAAAVDEGLTVPVLHGVQSLTLRQISEKTRDLVQRARTNKLSLDELSGSTFSISNMGMLDLDNFIAIVNQPNAAILAVSSVRKRAVVNDQDEIVVRPIMNITASFDHRVVDGARGAAFINIVKKYLENPTKLLS